MTARTELLERCPLQFLPQRGQAALCAVSGGLDSMCLLFMLDAWCKRQGGRIAAAGALAGAEAAHVIDGHGRFLTPGFIDIHRHADAALFRSDFGRAELAQGLTTILNGNCGLSLAPVFGPHQRAVLDYLTPIVGEAGEDFSSLADYRRRANGTPLPLNAGMLAGMGTLRACTAGFRNGDLTGDEYRLIHASLEQAMADGALGVSLGLGYAPECFYTTEQLIRSLAPLRRSGRREMASWRLWRRSWPWHGHWRHRCRSAT